MAMFWLLIEQSRRRKQRAWEASGCGYHTI